MGKGFEGAVLRLMGAKEHEVTVVGHHDLVPELRRIRFTSDTLLADIEVAPTAWIRLWFPDRDGGNREFQRGYTIVAADADQGWFDIDFVLHGTLGPASAWAQDPAPGARLTAQVMGSTSFTYAGEPGGVVLIGDACSLPAINSILAELPAEVSVDLLLEHQREAEERFPVAEHPGLTLHRVAREGTETLAQAAAELNLDNRQLWAAAEAGSLKPVRKLARQRAGFRKDNTYILAYWTQGREMGSSR